MPGKDTTPDVARAPCHPPTALPGVTLEHSRHGYYKGKIRRVDSGNRVTLSG